MSEEERKKEERELVKMASASGQRVLDNEDARQQIKSAIEKGNVQSDGDMTLVSQPDGPMEIRNVRMWARPSSVHPSYGLDVSWGKPGVGFGTVTFVMKDDGILECESEAMGKKFVKEVMSALVDKAKFRG